MSKPTLSSGTAIGALIAAFVMATLPGYPGPYWFDVFMIYAITICVLVVFDSAVWLLKKCYTWFVNREKSEPSD